MSDDTEVEERTLEALWNINKQARTYKQASQANYRKGIGGSAKKRSMKGKALYALKSAVLEDILPATERVELHGIGNNGYYCMYFEGYSFHVPTSNIDVPDGLLIDGKVQELPDFDKDDSTGERTMSLKSALRHIDHEVDHNANDYIPTEKDKYRWMYLRETDADGGTA